MRERKNSAFSWITNSMRRKKKKPKGSEAEVGKLGFRSKLEIDGSEIKDLFTISKLGGRRLKDGVSL